LKCEYNFSILDVYVRELLHIIFENGSVVFNWNLQNVCSDTNQYLLKSQWTVNQTTSCQPTLFKILVLHIGEVIYTVVL